MIRIKIQFSKPGSNRIFQVVRTGESLWSIKTYDQEKYLLSVDTVKGLSIRKMLKRVRRAIKLL